VDLKILTLLAEGFTNRHIASVLNVSASYVSKVKNGKKASYIPTVSPTLNKNDLIDTYTNLSDDELIEYLETQIEHAMIQIQVNKLIIRRIKNNEQSN
jgi:transcriptional regulator with XRE-family HTH domain